MLPRATPIESLPGAMQVLKEMQAGAADLFGGYRPLRAARWQRSSRHRRALPLTGISTGWATMLPGTGATGPVSATS